MKLVTYPNKLLSQVSSEVKLIDKNIIQLTNMMHFKLKELKGLGLSAVQVGHLKRIIVIDTRHMGGEKLSLINPVLLESSNEQLQYPEGCLSFPGVFIPNFRAKVIKVQYKDLDGKDNIKELSDVTAFCFLHELDHLNGLTMERFYDRI